MATTFLPAHVPGVFFPGGVLSGRLRGGGSPGSASLWVKIRTPLSGSGTCARLSANADGTGSPVEIRASASAVTATDGSNTLTAACQPGQILHAVLALSGTSAVLFVNGAQAAAGSFSHAPGRRFLRAGTFPGRLHRLGVWNRALNASDAAALGAHGPSDADRWGDADSGGCILDADCSPGCGRHLPDRSLNLSGLDCAGELGHVLPLSYGSGSVVRVLEDSSDDPLQLLELPPNCGLTGVEFEIQSGGSVFQVGTAGDADRFLSASVPNGLTFVESSFLTSLSSSDHVPVFLSGAGSAVGKVRAVYEIRGLPSEPVPPPPEIVVRVEADPEEVPLEGLSYLTAEVENSDQGVTWSLEDGPGELQDETPFTVTYVAPEENPDPEFVATVRGTSIEDPSKFDEAEIEIVITPPPPTILGVTCDAEPELVEEGGSSLVTAVVTGTGAYDPSVTFSIESGSGILSFVSSSQRWLTVTGTDPVTVRATSDQDPSKWGEDTVSVIGDMVLSFDQEEIGWPFPDPSSSDPEADDPINGEAWFAVGTITGVRPLDPDHEFLSVQCLNGGDGTTPPSGISLSETAENEWTLSITGPGFIPAEGLPGLQFRAVIFYDGEPTDEESNMVEVSILPTYTVTEIEVTVGDHSDEDLDPGNWMTPTVVRTWESTAALTGTKFTSALVDWLNGEHLSGFAGPGTPASGTFTYVSPTSITWEGTSSAQRDYHEIEAEGTAFLQIFAPSTDFVYSNTVSDTMEPLPSVAYEIEIHGPGSSPSPIGTTTLGITVTQRGEALADTLPPTVEVGPTQWSSDYTPATDPVSTGSVGAVTYVSSSNLTGDTWIITYSVGVTAESGGPPDPPLVGLEWIGLNFFASIGGIAPDLAGTIVLTDES